MADQEIEVAMPDLGLNPKQLAKLEERLNSTIVEELGPQGQAAKTKTKIKIKDKQK